MENLENKMELRKRLLKEIEKTKEEYELKHGKGSWLPNLSDPVVYRRICEEYSNNAALIIDIKKAQQVRARENHWFDIVG